MYIVINKSDNTIVHKNSHPLTGLSGKDIYHAYESDKHDIIFSDYYNEEFQKIENKQVVNRSKKEITEYRISKGLQEALSDSQKIDDKGNVVHKTYREKYSDGILSESAYRNIIILGIESDIDFLRDNIMRGIINVKKFKNPDSKIEEDSYIGFIYKNLRFEADEKATERINKYKSLVDTIHQKTGQYVFANDWFSNSQIDGIDIRYKFTDYTDLCNFAIEIASFWSSTLLKAKDLKDELRIKTTHDLESYDVFMTWNPIVT